MRVKGILSAHILFKHSSRQTCEAATRRPERRHHRRQKTSEPLQKGKALETGCQDRRLGLCAVYLSPSSQRVSADTMSAPPRPTLWVAGRQEVEVEVHKAARLNRGADWEKALMEPTFQTQTIAGPEAGA